jgi:hypothetical protein
VASADAPGADDYPLAPHMVGLREARPSETYLDDYERVWIGPKWDIAQGRDLHFSVYRKGNYVLQVGTLDLACRIVKDDGGFGR